MQWKKINKTRYDDPGKPMKQTSFTVKNLGRNLLEKQFTIVKKSFRSNTKIGRASCRERVCLAV